MCHLPPFLYLSSAPLLSNSVLMLSVTGLLTCFPSWPLHVPLSLLMYFMIFPALILLPSLWALTMLFSPRAIELLWHWLFCVPVASHGNSCTTKARYHFYIKGTMRLPY